jgi:hypothetical protein
VVFSQPVGAGESGVFGLVGSSGILGVLNNVVFIAPSAPQIVAPSLADVAFTFGRDQTADIQRGPSRASKRHRRTLSSHRKVEAKIRKRARVNGSAYAELVYRQSIINAVA